MADPTSEQPAEIVRPVVTRRIGRWTYGDHPGLNPGWRLADTNLVIDRDGHDGYVLWTDGRPGQVIDRYLDGAMRYIEQDRHAVHLRDVALRDDPEADQ